MSVGCTLPRGPWFPSEAYLCTVGSYTPWISFPTPDYLPQYVSFFLIDTLTVLGNWFERVPASWGKLATGVALDATIALPLIALTGQAALRRWSLTMVDLHR